jgi:hypothetical protein
MENLLLILATSFVLRLSATKKLQHSFIGNTGCFFLFPKGIEFELTRTESGDDLYFNEFSEKGIIYGIICVDMKQRFPLQEATEMLGQYMNKLKGPFFIFHSLGHQEDQDWNHTSSSTLVDYWQDAAGRDCKVKGYTDGKILAVLYVKNISEIDVAKQDAYLDSFHFKS